MSASGNSPETVLIVEADVLVRHPLAEYLRECGYKVLEALNTAEARALITEGQKIDTVLADTQGISGGFDLANWLRAQYPDITVILAGTVSKAVQKAGDICEDGPAINKPYDHQFVLDHIRLSLAARARKGE